MKALVTGATGFIGSHLVRRLVAGGWDVTVTKRKTSSLKLLEGLDLHFVEWDIRREPTSELLNALGNVDVVFHIAGLIKTLDESDFYEVNFEGTRRLFDAASEQPNISRFVYFSSQAAAGPSPTPNGIDETDRPHPVCHYGRSKLLAEEYIKRKGCVPFVIIRPPTVFGENDPETGVLFGSAVKGWRFHITGRLLAVSVVYVDDLVEGVIRAATAPIAENRTYFFSYERAVSMDEFYAAMGKVLRRRLRCISVGVTQLRAVATLAHFLGRLLGFTPSLNIHKIPHFTQRYWVIRSERARKELGFRPSVSFEEAVERTLRSIR